MFHLNSQILQSLLNGTVTPSQLQRIRQHVRECRACAGRLEEWSDDHPSVARRFPTLERGTADEARASSGGLVMMPMTSRILPAWLRPRQLIWTGVGLLLVGAASGAVWLLRPKSEVQTVVLPDSTRPPLQPPDPSRFAGNAAPAPDTPAAAAEAAPRIEPLPVSDDFRAITGRDAVNRLGSPIRLIDGVDPDHFESGPPGAAPGAQRGAPLVRVVYRAPNDGRVHLDQQFIRADSTGFRTIDDPALENGDTVYREAGGRRSATWLDESGYLLTLSGPMTRAELRTLIGRVR
jgi:anti-sigma factor RsiW